ncbi:GNAT family N-acetyltransferase [Oscillatoria acuminata]|uniref:Acetyltransferase n=1 Tax=Oscillatoria acuminata PCC 6304 TaxID=56110 RepID=K9TG87_9CYAN|nr:GNAT family N-acetyltransferase [Oscillatoria acuminata]AFY81862.1 acetyltransferase [Oscillatoria acuminata PCC 6304]
MIEIIEADLNLPAHAAAMVQLMDTYALDPMGGGQGLSEFVKANLPSELAKRKSAHVILAFVEGEPAGLVIGLEGFSTFACQPLLNIHDVIVALPYRGRGLSKLLLQKAEAIALNLCCCKLTLEVLENNHVAQSAYRAFGFTGYELNPLMGKALFWEKKLLKNDDIF